MQKRRHKGEDKAVLALAGGASRRQAAEAAGVHERTLRKWINQDPLFRQRVENARDELFRESFSALAGVCKLAVDTLRDLLHSDSDQARLGAAKAIIENTHRAREVHELSERIAALEAAQQKVIDHEPHRATIGAA